MRRKEMLYVCGAIHQLASDRFPSDSQCPHAEPPQSGIVSELSLRSTRVKTGLFLYF
jgi:hypothetical protein